LKINQKNHILIIEGKKGTARKSLVKDDTKKLIQSCQVLLKNVKRSLPIIAVQFHG
jgi:hypothetical protein